MLPSRGYELTVQTDALWLLQVAKTLSYAVNRAVLREAARRGADDVLFTTIDGYVFEGPTSSLVAKFGDTIATPAQSGGVLHGTAQIGASAFFKGAGFRTEYRHMRVSEPADADALWLTNSARLAAPIRAVDAKYVNVDAELTGRLNGALRGR